MLNCTAVTIIGIGYLANAHACPSPTSDADAELVCVECWDAWVEETAKAAELSRFRLYYWTHRAQVTARQRRYYRSHKAQARVRVTRWRQANKERVNAAALRRYHEIRLRPLIAKVKEESR